MPFQGIRLLEQAEQKFCPIRVCLKEKQKQKKSSDRNNRALLLYKSSDLKERQKDYFSYHR